MIVHLGRRVSALVDGQLSASEAERAWQHVHMCCACRDLVEREGRIKTQLAGLARGHDAAPSYLKGSLLGDISALAPSAGQSVEASQAQTRVILGLLGTSAVGVAMLGALVLTVPFGQTPTVDRRLPISDLSATSAPEPTPIGVQQAQPTVLTTIDVITKLAKLNPKPQPVQRGHQLVRYSE